MAPVLLLDCGIMKQAPRVKAKPAKLRWLRNSEGRRVGLILPS
jgi:hypothetical protein